MFRLLGWLAKKAFRFATKPYKKGWKMWQAGKGMKPFSIQYASDAKWLKRTTQTLTGDALANPRTRLIYQSFVWAKTPPGMEFIQPLARIDYRSTFSRAKRSHIRPGGWRRNGVFSPWAKGSLAHDTFRGDGLILPKTSNLYAYLATEYGMNFNVDRTIDRLTGKKYRKKMEKAAKVLGEFSTKPNRQKRARSRISGVSLDPYKGNLGAMKNVKQDLSYMNLSVSYDTFGSNDLSDFYSLELNDKNLDYDSEVKDALTQLGNPENAAGTSFPRAPGTWLESALFSNGMMDISPKEGKTTIVPAGQELFKQMSNSAEPGKLLWRGPWLYKRKFKKKAR